MVKMARTHQARVIGVAMAVLAALFLPWSSLNPFAIPLALVALLILGISLKGYKRTLVFSVAIAAVHFIIAVSAFVAIGFSAMSTAPDPVPFAVLEWVFLVFTFPIAQLPGTESMAWLVVNSMLWGFTLVAVPRWIWNRRKRRIVA